MRLHTTWLVALTLLATSIEPAAARRFRGEWTNAYSRAGGSVRFTGRLDTATGTVSGRVRCGACPPRGRLRLSCGPLESNARSCVGTSRSGCAVEGSLYLQVFEGTYDCGPGVAGVLSFGRR